MLITVNNLIETNILAQNLASSLTQHDIILLHGDLGAGKTTFTKAVAAAIGVKDMVTSPTFAFMREYFGKFKLSHYDMYRVDSDDELWELGIADNLEEEGLCIIEWNKFKYFSPSKRVINITIVKGDDEMRYFNIEGDIDENFNN